MMEQSNINQETPEKEKIVSDAELGFSYRETVIDLPGHRAKETGINRVKRRELLTIPEDAIIRDASGKLLGYNTYENINYNFEALPFYSRVTDGKYPSQRVWDHTMNVDTLGIDQKYQEHLKENLYFQPVYLGDKISISTKIDRNKIGVGNLYTVPGDATWGPGINSPVYFFGNKNPNFVKYIESILASDYARAELAKEGWIDKPLDPDLIAPGEEGYGKGKFPFGDFRQDERESKIIDCYKSENVHFPKEREAPPIEMIHNLDMLRKLIAGVPIWLTDVHRLIPIIQHPDIKPLRWCHAEMALIPTSRSLNVLFFEQ